MFRYSDRSGKPGAACPTYVPLVVTTEAPTAARASRVGSAGARKGSKDSATEMENFIATGVQGAGAMLVKGNKKKKERKIKRMHGQAAQMESDESLGVDGRSLKVGERE